MKRGRTWWAWGMVAALTWAASPASALACAACFGKSDSKMAVGMNWGILTLLAVVVVVLTGFAAFTIYLIRRAARTAPGTEAGALRTPPQSF